MFKIMLALHLLTAIFVVGPLVHITTTSARGLRTGDAVATAAAARGSRIYGALSTLVVILGFGLMSQKAPWDKSRHVAEFGDLWIWLSVLLWLVGAAIALAVLEPSLRKATSAIEAARTKVASTTRSRSERRIRGSMPVSTSGMSAGSRTRP